METRLSSPGAARWAFLAGVIAVAGALSYYGVRIARATHFAGLETREGLERAARIEPGNAEYWYLLGRYWQYNFDQPDLSLAISYYRRALGIDPRSANIWMDLAGAEEALGRTEQARRDFQQAQTAYPISADVAWRYGNFLLRQGDTREGFAQIRHAVEADPSRAAAGVAVCWQTAPEIDAILNEALPANASVYREAVRFLSLEQHAGSAALAAWKRLATLHPQIEMNAAIPLVDELLAEGRAAEARSVWEQAAEFAGIGAAPAADGSAVWDGGFEGDFIPGGFGWQWTPHPGVGYAFVRDTSHFGARSLRITFEGEENLDFEHLFQNVPVEPGATYQFSAYVKTEDITTNRGVGFSISDPRNPGTQGGLTAELTGTQPWTHLETSFKAGPQTHFVRIVLRRHPSEKLDNKLRGTVWVDDVSLVPLDTGHKRSAR